MPAGYRLEAHDELASTNSHAMQRASAGALPGLWVTARRQTHGKGRADRAWASPAGNLYASLTLAPGCPLALAQQLALVAAVATREAMLAAAGARLPPEAVRLKWPNDVLITGAKAAGILLESGWAPGAARLNVVMGIGINLASHPAGLDQPATSLAAHGIDLDPQAMLERLAHALDRWLAAWQSGAGFAAVRTAWLAAGPRPGDPIRVHAGKRAIAGRFAGLEEDGALMLATEAGATVRVASGDVETLAPRAQQEARRADGEI